MLNTDDSDKNNPQDSTATVDPKQPKLDTTHFIEEGNPSDIVRNYISGLTLSDLQDQLGIADQDTVVISNKKKTSPPQHHLENSRVDVKD